ncbi:hypothetical protein [Microtetraspora sp. NBRC 16547]|uniref:hypothetical protein n=1 Tax=Microtetraspora sp. NBRC 16547 TaxID=3030993 RepID=UPI0024A3AF69|nr:hypothetical protein [Microtetraspora sp. NBRC 16547]GLX00242.1 hypothetical protein Misp02_43280 [Microtetraspora sp. NBRC 16547]
MDSEEFNETPSKIPSWVLKMIFRQMAVLFGADDDPHLGDDSHALDLDEYLDETDDPDDLDDEF